MPSPNDNYPGLDGKSQAHALKLQALCYLKINTHFPNVDKMLIKALTILQQSEESEESNLETFYSKIGEINRLLA